MTNIKIFVKKMYSLLSIAVVLVIPGTTGGSFTNQVQGSALEKTPSNAFISATSTYGELPLSFVPNAGQYDDAVKYQARGMGGMLFFENDMVVLSLSANDQVRHTTDQTSSIVRLHFENVGTEKKVVNGERLPGIVNYFIGNDPSLWRSNLPTYGGIIYQQIYPGIDLSYNGSQRTLKGTYTLSPHADPSSIRWHYDGISGAQVDKQTGDLVLQLADGSTLIEKAPSAWQTKGGVRLSVLVKYDITVNGSIGFVLGGYDANASLTIDPLLIYSTYLGGNAFDGAKSVAVDFAGNAYITGVTYSSNFPTENPLSAARNGATDAFVVKINPAGTALVYATYLGGSLDEDLFGSERAGGIAVDSSGKVYMTGCTTSADFPTVNPIQGTHGATTNCDVYISKLNEAGTALIYSTFLGGNGADAANAIAVDDQGSVYIAGDAGKGFPGSVFTSSTHVFVSKINPEGSAVLFSYFIGGNSYEYATDIAVDGSHNIYVVGNTYSTDFPILNPVQPTIGGGTSSHHDAFVTKIQADGGGLLYSTYLGGSNTDEASGIAVDDLGSAYITGVTQSLDFPLMNAFQPVYGGERGDAFVTKLSPAGDALVYSTYLGGNNDENYFSGHGPYGGIAVDSTYNATVTGYSCSTNFPAYGSFVKPKNGSCYAFVTRFKPEGNAIAFSTLIGTQSGSSNNTYGNDIALDPQGNIFVVGETNANDFLTIGALQPTYGGLYDAFIAKINPYFWSYLPLTIKAPANLSTLQVTSPNGGEQWKPGTSHNITWKQSALTGFVTIQLYKGGSLSSQIGSASAPSGSFAWNIPSNQTAGYDYQIRIFQGLVEDYSDANFSIVAIRKYDLLGSWATGVSSLNSDNGAWSLITSSPATMVAAGDMDGDGIDDIVTNFASSGLWVKYSRTGQWQFISSSPTGIAVGDFNGDGKADLAGIWGGVVWIRDSATGSWTAGPASATVIAAGDLNGDGKADLIVNYPTTGVWVQFSASGAWSNLTPDPATKLVVGDFDGDGKGDLVGIWNGIVWIKYYAGSWVAGPSDATEIAAGDLNGDGKADLIVNYPASGIWVQYSAIGAWSNLTSSPATTIATGLLR